MTSSTFRYLMTIEEEICLKKSIDDSDKIDVMWNLGVRLFA